MLWSGCVDHLLSEVDWCLALRCVWNVLLKSLHHVSKSVLDLWYCQVSVNRTNTYEAVKDAFI